MYEEKVLDLIEYMETTNTDDMKINTQKIDKLINYLASYNSNVNDKIKKALDNVLKLKKASNSKDLFFENHPLYKKLFKKQKSETAGSYKDLEKLGRGRSKY